MDSNVLVIESCWSESFGYNFSIKNLKNTFLLAIIVLRGTYIYLQDVRNQPVFFVVVANRIFLSISLFRYCQCLVVCLSKSFRSNCLKFFHSEELSNFRKFVYFPNFASERIRNWPQFGYISNRAIVTFFQQCNLQLDFPQRFVIEFFVHI
jgi:hypothetical protein